MKILRTAALVIAVAIFGCSERYPTEAKLYCDRAIEVLIERGVCKDRQDCSKKEAAFWEGGAPWRKMTYLNLYGIGEPEVVNAVAEQLRLERVRLEPGVTISAYRSRHLETKQKLIEIVIE